jgi:excisionase family DNA binding protein
MKKKITSSAPVLFRKSEVAAVLRVSVRTIDRYIRGGVLKRVKVGGSTRFALADVLKFVKRQKEEGGETS